MNEQRTHHNDPASGGDTVDRCSGRLIRQELLAHTVSPVVHEPGTAIVIEDEPWDIPPTPQQLAARPASNGA